MLEIDLTTALVAAAALLLGGFVKGAIGMGLPLIAVPIISYVTPTPTAIAVLAAPILAANGAQIIQTRAALPATLKRFWPLYLAMFLGIVIGAQLLLAIEERLVFFMLGAILLGFASADLARLRFPEPGRHEAWFAPTFGAVSGLLGGLTSFYGQPVVLYFAALRLNPERFVAALGVLYLTGSLALYPTLAVHDVLGPREAWASLMATPPALLAQWFGRRLRQRIDAESFRRLVMVGLLAMGASLVYRGLAA